MKPTFSLLFTGLLLATAAAKGQDLINAGATITVQSGAVLYVGAGGFTNQVGGTLTNAGAVRVDGPLTTAGTLDLNSGTLEVRGDVTNAGTLLPGTSPVTFSGTADQVLTPGGGALYQMLLNKPTAGANTLRLAGDLTVNHLLSLTNGLVTTKNGATVYTLSLPHGATLAGEAPGRYVQGELAITRNAVSGAAVDFGHGAVLDPTTNNLGAVVITRTAGLATPDVSFGQNVAAAAQQGIDRIWTVAPATQPSAAVQLTLSWIADNDNSLADFSQARAWQQTAPGLRWTHAGPEANANARSIVATPAVLDRFTVSNVANPLPVTLINFAAQAEGPAAVRLHWSTASELNNAGFTVERSLDAHTFSAVGIVAGHGTSATGHDYALLDSRLPVGAALLYYRLRQTDANGDVTFSPVRTVALLAQAASFAVFPTKVPTGQVATYLYTGSAEPGTLVIIDLLGRLLRTTAVDGRTQGEVPLAGLANGVYLLRYTTASASFAGHCVVE